MSALKQYTDTQKQIKQYIAGMRLSHYPDLLEYIFSEYNLDKYLEYYLNHDTTINFNSYHNRVHSFSVALNCYEGVIILGLGPQQIRILLLAGLYHDFNHSQGWYDDKFNVEIAIKGFIDAHTTVPMYEKLCHEDYLKVKAAIRATKVPYNDMVVNDTIFKIIRDADLMMPYELASVRLNSYIGLFTEANNTKDVYIKDFCQERLEFSLKIKWNTKWAKKKYMILDYPRMINAAMDDLKDKFKVTF